MRLSGESHQGGGPDWTGWMPGRGCIARVDALPAEPGPQGGGGADAGSGGRGPGQAERTFLELTGLAHHP